ncbi:MAG: UDP-3-O-(3-hydroxymyristoyl)glucosamine N-acyltransferase [Candidatus Cloacimonetes bacterium]|nr:UDP-3-O-(3-hydroxymyristoyl)glucosamine N-acyltransferase [Candidatus Cloacimonadota bacterium]
MRLLKFNISLDTILAITQGKCNSQTDKTINNVAELDEANKNSLCFYENIKYKDKFNISSAGFVLVPRDLDLNEKENQILIKVDKPYLSFMTILTWYLEQEKKSFIPTISPNTDISNSAKIGHNVHIAPFAVIGNNVKIGSNSYIGSNVVIMNDVCIGENVKIYSNVTIYENCKIGNNSILHSGVVIGADGFGYTLIDGNQIKIPQVGNVVIEDDVEIGANTCIDRATIGSTIIKSNSKIDNLVQVGHNCTIEEHSILCAQVGLAGNTHIGKTVYLAGQVGVGGHLKIDDGTLIAAQSGVANSLPTGQYFGTPAISAYEQKKIIYSLKDLPTVVRYVKKLMKEN